MRHPHICLFSIIEDSMRWQRCRNVMNFSGGAGQTHTCKDIMTSESTLLSFNTCPNGIVWGNRNVINIVIGSKCRKFMVKSPELDESGEGTTHDHRSQRTKAVTWTSWALQVDRWDLANKSIQNICVLLSKVVRDALGPERERSDDDYSL